MALIITAVAVSRRVWRTTILGHTLRASATPAGGATDRRLLLLDILDLDLGLTLGVGLAQALTLGLVLGLGLRLGLGLGLGLGLRLDLDPSLIITERGEACCAWKDSIPETEAAPQILCDPETALSFWWCRLCLLSFMAPSLRMQGTMGITPCVGTTVGSAFGHFVREEKEEKGMEARVGNAGRMLEGGSESGGEVGVLISQFFYRHHRTI